MKLVGWKRLLANPYFFWYTIIIPIALLFSVTMIGGIVSSILNLCGKEIDIISLVSKALDFPITIYGYFINLLFILRLWVFYNISSSVKAFLHNHIVGCLCCLNITMWSVQSLLHTGHKFTGIALLDFCLMFGGFILAILFLAYKVLCKKETIGNYCKFANEVEQQQFRNTYQIAKKQYYYVGGTFALCFVLFMIFIGYRQVKGYSLYEMGKDAKSLFVKKNYQIVLNGSNKEIYVYMRCPSIGIAGINEIRYDGFTYDEVEEQLFEDIRHNSFDGDWRVYVILEYKDDYGNYYYDDEKIYVSTLNGNELRRYADYSYFRGKADLQNAFPWNKDNL